MTRNTYRLPTLPRIPASLASLACLVALFVAGACDVKNMDQETASTSDSGTSDSTTDDSSSTGGETNDSSGGSDSSTSDATTGDSSSGSDSSTSQATTIGTSESSTGTDATTDATTTDGTTTDTTGTSTTGDPPDGCDGEPIAIEGLVTSMAYLQSQIPPDMTTGGSSSGSSSGSSGGDEPDPGTLHISLSNQAITCDAPNGSLECGENWELSLVIPPEFQSPGLYTVGTENILGIATETGPDEGGDQCGFGGGSWSATLEIIAIDDTLVEGRLCNVDEFWSWTNPELTGVFYAERCPG